MPGYFYTETRIREDAEPIDGVTKHAWLDDDYEDVEVWHEYTEEELANIADAEDQRLNAEIIDSLPDAMAELSMAVSDGADVAADLADAIAELSAIVSTLVEGA